MANPWAGEVAIMLGGKRHVLKLTLGALAELEGGLDGSIVKMVERFEGGQAGARDVLAVIVAGLRGGGWRGRAEDLTDVEIEGGFQGAGRVAAELLVRAFSGPGT
ncbi:MAG: gene transfer agent family protein [Pseudomonadota bacterium]